MPVFEITDASERERACRDLIKALPDWFGIRRVNRQYIKEAGDYAALGYRENACDEIQAMLVYKKMSDEVLGKDALNIHWMGVHPELHRKGIGAHLISRVLEKASDEGISHVTVETLNPKAGDEFYLKTYAFYKSFGFTPYEEVEYNLTNPIVRLYRQL